MNASQYIDNQFFTQFNNYKILFFDNLEMQK